MKRAARFFFHGAAGVSGVLFIFAVGFWGASYRSLYSLDNNDRLTPWTTMVARGELGILINSLNEKTTPFRRIGMRRWDWDTTAHGDLDVLIRLYVPPGRSPVCGCYFGTEYGPLGSSSLLLLPLPFVAFLFAPLPLADVMMIRRRRRRGRRLAAGLCVRCGYDLRASPDRCPECGAMLATMNSI